MALDKRSAWLWKLDEEGPSDTVTPVCTKTRSVLIQRPNRVTRRDNDRAGHLPPETCAYRKRHPDALISYSAVVVVETAEHRPEGPAFTDLIAGQVQVMFPNVVGALEHISRVGCAPLP
jgi:hypothetical protein